METLHGTDVTYLIHMAYAFFGIGSVAVGCIFRWARG